MRNIVCPICGSICIKYGKNKSGSQRWFCKACGAINTPKIDNKAKQLKIFLQWLFGRDIQNDMPESGRTFRRKTSEFWNIWTLPPMIEVEKDIVYVDGIYLGRKACILICCDNDFVLGWYLCRYEHSGAWRALMSRIAEPKIVISDGGTGFNKALKNTWSNSIHQRCLFHVFSQIRRYTTSNPRTLAGIELYMIAKDLLHIQSKEEANIWIEKFKSWRQRYDEFLSQMSYDENGSSRPTHEKLLKAERSMAKLVKDKTLFNYLNEKLKKDIGEIPCTNNKIEGGVNARLRAMLRNHRGLSLERRIKAVFWWCYTHSPEPLSASEILKTMPTDDKIADIYKRMTQRGKLEDSIPRWGDSIVWNELHKSINYPIEWD